MPPDGLQEAVQAFHVEINPVADRPRDESGRFAQTARPEPMFEPRPLEGDPLTGDTRDGGDDARLNAIERRIADGRSQEGDDVELKRLQDAQSARTANGDGRHQQQTDEQGRGDDKPKQQDQHPEGKDAKPGAEGDEGDAEGSPEQDAEGPRYEVTVDGQTQEVSLQEALKGYIRKQTFDQRMSHLHEARQSIENEGAQIGQARDYYIGRLQYLDRLLQTLTPQQPNWDQEFQADPREAYRKQKAYGEVLGQIQTVNQQIQQEQAIAQQEYDRKAQHYAVNQFAQFVQEANIQDEPTLTKEMADIRSYLRDVGFNEGEIASTYDKRMLRVAREGMKYRQSVAEQPKPVAPGRGKTLTPGVASPVGNVTSRSLNAAMDKLAKTGRVDDAAQYFQALIR